MNLFDLIQQQFEDFTKTEETIAAYILNNPKNFARHTIEESVQATGTSKAAMIRFAKKLGYNGYSELKFDLSRLLISSSFNNPEEEIKDNEAVRFITAQYCQSIGQINETVSYDEVRKLARTILEARRVKIFAINRTALSAMQLQMRALKIGVDLGVVTTSEVMMQDTAALLTEQDLCLIFSIKDNGRIYPVIVDSLNENGCPVCLVTMTPQMAIAKNCTQVITLPQISQGYGKFIDEQAIYFVFVEILLHELAQIAK